MSIKSKPQILSIENEFGADFLIPHCPFCGVRPLDPEDGSEHYCEHLQFLWVGAVGDFQYKSADFRSRLEGVEAAEDREFEPELLVDCGYSAGLVVMEVTNSGMACGPVSYTDCYGFAQVEPEE